MNTWWASHEFLRLDSVVSEMCVKIMHLVHDVYTANVHADLCKECDRALEILDIMGEHCERFSPEMRALFAKRLQSHQDVVVFYKHAMCV